LKVLIIQNILPHYRIDLYNKLSVENEVTVFHSGIRVSDLDLNFKQIVVKKNKVGPFYFQFALLNEINKNYDTIISMLDIRWPLNYMISFLTKKKIIWWGPWLTKSNFANILRIFFMNKNYKTILYSNFHKMQFINRGINRSNLFVANNSIEVQNRVKSYNFEKEIILFSGSFNKRKKIKKIILLFHEIVDLLPENIKLYLVGDGDEYDDIKLLVSKLKLNDKIILTGRITNSNDLCKLYKKAFFSISYGQAGLSILQSFGYGAPFLCCENAVSGGEIFNIKNNYNGYLAKSDNEFKKYMIELTTDYNLYYKLGKNAYDYYSEYCTIDKMVYTFNLLINK